MKFVADLEQFQAQRRGALDSAAERFRSVLPEALDRLDRDGWWVPVAVMAEDVFDENVAEEGVDADLADFGPTLSALEETLPRTGEDPNREAQVERLALWLAVFTVNAATQEAIEVEQGGTGDLILREWVTMQDEVVRETHRPVNGERRPAGEPFTVAGVDMPFPGAPVGPPALWMGCRCVVRPVSEGDQMSTSFAEQGEPVMDAEVTDDEMREADWSQELLPVPVHGVLLDVTEETGDGRHLAGNFSVLSVEDGPVPLRWVKSDTGAHDGAVRVGSITSAWREGDRMLWDGNLMDTPEANEVMGLLVEGRVGLSVDMDSAVFDMDEDADDPVMRFTEGRIRAATLVDIPALTSAWAQLGSWGETATLAASGCVPCQEQMRYRTFKISEAEWDGSSSRFTDEEWCKSTIVHLEDGCTSKSQHKMPIREPNGDLNRAAVHNAAARFNQVEAPESALSAARQRLREAYNELGEDPPEVIAASDTETFQVPGIPPQTKDAPGWITHPRETSRLRRYWTEGPGAAKIAWGTPGDFNRCRANLVKYVQRPDWLAGLCANMHFDALGFWPGAHRARTEGAIVASALSMYEEKADVLPSEWFEDPNLPGPTPITVTDEGRVFGHIAIWGVCHTASGPMMGEACTTPPKSQSGYAYYRTGVVDTTAGEVPVGNLTMGTGHAGQSLGAASAAAHYDDTGAVVADVVAGEDSHGIWFSGALRPNLTDEQMRAFKASKLSGDWREIGGNLELVAALSVNVPGFPIPRVGLAASGGRQTALTAAGIVKDEQASAMHVDVTLNPGTVKAFANALEQEMANRKVMKEFLLYEREQMVNRL